ncbi:MAG: VWA domain-containing protein [Bacteroidetes bacterium]|nr:MAG: VWA domain-containing protein [Bacteroidota bacterium]
MKKTIAYIILLLIPVLLHAQAPQPKTRILFIFDASNSMNGSWQSGNKHQIAHRLLSEALDSLQYLPNLELALRVYGHQKYYKLGQDCNDTKLEVPFGKNNVPQIKEVLQNIQPKGTTPIALTLEKAAEDFPPCSNCRNVIILITDGIEECGGDPCAVSLALQKQGIILKPFVIGIGLDMQFIETFKCVGNYYDANTEEGFKNVLKIVISQALNSTTAQVNLLDINGKPTETNVNMTFYDQFSGKILYNYIHTINDRGNPDTIPLDPIPTYKMVVHTIPKVEKDSIKLTPGKHNIIAVDAPQGFLKLKMDDNLYAQNLKAIIRKQNEMQTLHVQNFNTTEKYIVGNYDIEILTLPRTYINQVNIKQSHTTTVEIPKPGIVTFLSKTQGYGSIYVMKDGKMEWIYNLNDNNTRETLKLQPGSYKVVWIPKSAKKSIYTIERDFDVNPGSSQAVKLF